MIIEGENIARMFENLNYKIYFKKHNIILFLAICFSVVIRFFCKNFESEDFIKFLNEWVKFYRENGGFYALKDFEGDYNVLYQYVLIIISYLDINCLYLVKLVSVLFDFILAYGCAKCLDAFGVDIQKQRLCFAIIILLPTILLNSSFWGQCDSIYVAFIVWSIYFLARKKALASISFLAVAFALKLQTVFIMPVYFVAFLKKDIRFREFIIFPIIIVLTYLPAMFFGKSITDILKVYVTQTTEYPLMVMNAPTIFKLLGIHEYNSFLEKVFIGATAIYVLIIVFIAFKNKHNNLLEIALLFVIGIPFWLPHMHERYFYLATIFVVLCVFTHGKKYIPIMLCVEVSSLICYMHYFDFINRYCGKILSYLCSSYVSAMLMLLALVFALLAVFSKVDFKRHITCTVLMVTVIISIFLFSAQSRKFVWINDKMINFPTIEPYADEHGNVAIPIRNFVNAVGGELYFDDETQRIVISYNDSNISFAFNNTVAQVNDKTVAIDKVFVRNGHTYISHKDISEMFGINYTISDNKLFFHTN